MTKTQRQVLTTACLAHALIHVYELSVPALLIAIQADFGVGDLRIAGIVNLYAMLFGAGALPAGSPVAGKHRHAHRRDRA